jgi:DNA-binding NtrC family response regulator
VTTRPGESTVPVSQPWGGGTVVTRVLRVEVIKGIDRGLVRELPMLEARVGTDPGCEVVLRDPTVSRVHLELRIEDARIRVIDRGSRNGTELDGVPIRDAYARPDSTLTIGATTMALRMLDETVELRLSSRDRFGGLVGTSLAMRRVYTMLERIAPTDLTLLVEGETGTGKELAAEAVHEHSPRAAGPFVVFDCSAVSPALLEAELFGHVKGAFTGASSDRSGALELAHGGTLFLDEIGELSLDLQPKLLRALERREARRVGSSATRPVDVRLVAATNRSLAHEVECGRFREDLYYRLAVAHVVMPPLRDRLEDVPALVDLFREQLAARFASHPAPSTRGRLSGAEVRRLAKRPWPGNVRELRNAVARALSLGDQAELEIVAEPRSPEIDMTMPLPTARDAYERAYLTRALAETGGNITRAAELAGVNRKYVQRAMKRWGLRSERSAEDAEEDPQG